MRANRSSNSDCEKLLGGVAEKLPTSPYWSCDEVKKALDAIPGYADLGLVSQGRKPIHAATPRLRASYGSRGVSLRVRDSLEVYFWASRVYEMPEQRSGCRVYEEPVATRRSQSFRQ